MCVVLGVGVISVIDAVAFLACAHRVSSPAKAIWVEVCHQHWIHETQKHPHLEEHDVSEKRYRTDIGNSTIRTWDSVKKEFVHGCRK